MRVLKVECHRSDLHRANTHGRSAYQEYLIKLIEM